MIRKFSKQMQKRADQVENAASEATRKLALLIAREVAFSTPVDTGRARANWFAGINRPVEGTRAALAAGKGGSTGATNAARAFQQMESVIGRRKPGQAIYLSNNLPYIGALNDGSSAQAPAGFVEAAIKRSRLALGNVKVFR